MQGKTVCGWAVVVVVALLLAGCGGAQQWQRKDLQHATVLACSDNTSAVSRVDLLAGGSIHVALFSNAECRTWWYGQPWTVSVYMDLSNNWVVDVLVSEKLVSGGR
jgi:hypothetical protein